MKKKVKTVDEVHIGTEPTLVGTPDRASIIDAFNFYNYMYGIEQGKPWLMEFLKKNSYPKDVVEGIRSAPSWRTSPTICWMARMMSNGTTFNIDDRASFEEQLLENARYGVVAKEKNKVVADVQARMREMAEGVISDIEAQLDLNDANWSLYNYLQRNAVAAPVASKVRAYYQRFVDEVNDKDPQIKEAYGKKLAKWQKIYGGIVDDCARYTSNKKTVTVRKPRKTKAKPPSDLVKGVKYQKEFTPLKLVSVPPVNIIGAESVWLYNTKYKQLTLLTCAGPAGISVKGTTLVNFDADKSTQKTLRKPEDTIKEVMSAGKVAQRKIMPNLTTKASNASGRINADTIILRVLK